VNLDKEVHLVIYLLFFHLLKVVVVEAVEAATVDRDLKMIRDVLGLGSMLGRIRISIQC
jgi:hypothetical protein